MSPETDVRTRYNSVEHFYTLRGKYTHMHTHAGFIHDGPPRNTTKRVNEMRICAYARALRWRTKENSDVALLEEIAPSFLPFNSQLFKGSSRSIVITRGLMWKWHVAIDSRFGFAAARAAAFDLSLFELSQFSTGSSALPRGKRNF